MGRAISDPYMGAVSGFQSGLGFALQAKRLGIEESRAKTHEDIVKSTEKRNQAEFDWKSLDREKKENFEKAERSILKARQMRKAGKDEQAGFLYSQAYKLWPNGDEAMIAFPARHPELVQSGQIPPEMAQKEVVVISKGGGVMPIGSMDDLDKYIGAHFNQKTYLDTLKQADINLVKKNEGARSSPIQREDGSWVQEVYKAGPNGTPTFSGYTAFKGAIPMSQANKALRSIGIDPESLTDDDRRVLAKLQGTPPSKYAQGIEKKKMGIEEVERERKAGIEERETVVKEREATTKGVQAISTRLKKEAELKGKGASDKPPITAKQRADVYEKAQVAFNEEFAERNETTGAISGIRADAPTGKAKEEWIELRIESATGIKRPAKPKKPAPKVEATDLLKPGTKEFNMLPVEGQKIDPKNKEVQVYQLNDPGTGRQITLWADGTEIVTGKDGRKLGRRRIVRTKDGQVKVFHPIKRK